MTALHSPPPFPPGYDREMDERCKTIAGLWILAYLASTAIFFVAMTSGGWPHPISGEVIVLSLVIPALGLRFLARLIRSRDSSRGDSL